MLSGNRATRLPCQASRERWAKRFPSPPLTCSSVIYCMFPSRASNMANKSCHKYFPIFSQLPLKLLLRLPHKSLMAGNELELIGYERGNWDIFGLKFSGRTSCEAFRRNYSQANPRQFIHRISFIEQIQRCNLKAHRTDLEGMGHLFWLNFSTASHIASHSVARPFDVESKEFTYKSCF